MKRTFIRQHPQMIATAALSVTYFSGTAATAQIQFYETCSTLPAVPCSSIPIPDFPGPPAELTLNVPADPGSDCSIRRVSVALWIQHSWQGDLVVQLVSPSNTVVTLLNRPGLPQCGGAGFDADNLGGVYFDSCGGGSFLAPMQFSDNPVTPLGYYDPPAVPCDSSDGLGGGTTFGGTCCFCGPDFLSAWYPESPLSAFVGESKEGTWRLRVTDLAGADTGSIKYLGLSIETDPLTPPVAIINPPADFACACSGSGQISGTVAEPDGTLASWELAWSAAAAGPWTVFASGNSPISGVLGTLPALLPDGFSYLRLNATNCGGQTTTFVKVIMVDAAFSAAQFRSPLTGDLVGGRVCLDGTAVDACMDNYRVEWRTAGVGPYNVLLVSSSGVQNDPLGVFDTRTLCLPDGDYDLRLTGTTMCGYTRSHTITVTVDNTPPVAVISSPDNCDAVDGVVPIVGTVSDAHLSGWTLQYTGGPTNGWV